MSSLRFNWIGLLLVTIGIVAGPLALQAQDQPETAPPAAPPAARDPLVEQVFALNPQTPEQLIRALLVLIDINHAADGQPLLDKLAAAQLDDEALAKLGQQFGPAVLIRIAQQESLAPAAGEMVRKIQDAIARVISDPARINAAIAELSDPSALKRKTALQQLTRAGRPAVERLIPLLADDARAAERPALREALIALGSHAYEPLVVALSAGPLNLQIEAARLLPQLKVADAAWHLLAPALAPGVDTQLRQNALVGLRLLRGDVPDPAAAAAELYAEATMYYDGRKSLDRAAMNDPTAPREVWSWDTHLQRPAVQERPARQAALARAQQLADDAQRLAPGHAATQRLALGIGLELAGLEVGLDEPLPQGNGTAWARAAAAGPDAMIDLLTHASVTGHPQAAARAADVLGHIGDARLLLSDASQPAPLVRALRHTDRRVRFAALRAIAPWKVTDAYPGSSFVPEALAYFARAGSAPQAVVAHPLGDEAARLAGMLAELGYDVQVALDGRALFKLASATPDCELILLSTNLNLPTPAETLAMLRRDARTAKIPVGIVAHDDGFLTRAQRIAAADRYASHLIRPVTGQGMQVQVEPLVASAGLSLVPGEVRRAQAGQALAWMAQLAQDQNSIYDLTTALAATEHALFVPELSQGAAEVLGRLGSPQAQRALVDLASLYTLPIDTRRRAAAAFCQNVARFDVLLTTGEITRQYERYNQSEQLDRATQDLLSKILDCIEARAEADAELPSEPILDRPNFTQ
jgi:hypothetical protein